ncbi:ceramide synthase 5 [Octopus bimaculoides]|uniref:ceramide synthase 5 n=1 Tax=Octopus bimaculoides TaxID=37653 RepID=UPI00071C8C25|nr:ceramide synthase 5 [Octopus bimaculoides]|eukprot:XP_014789026.1 PREDICTED: ceramide synthase 5-like [Octopus bimaculoides]
METVEATSWWHTIRSKFWNEWFWLPRHLTWQDYLNKKQGMYKPQTEDLLWVPVLALALCLTRILFERYIATPIGKSLGIREINHRKPSPSIYLEEAFKKSRTPSHQALESYSKKLDLSVRQIQRWFRLRRNQEKANTLTRFTESCWRFTYYFTILIIGTIILYNKVWFWDSTECWPNYPHQHVPSEIYWYYLVELSYYVGSSLMHFTDVRKKDFWELFIHHIVTMTLMFIAWIQNIIRISCLILLVHDMADPFLEATKMASYSGHRKWCNHLFIVFTIAWYIGRLYIFPFKILYSTLFYAPTVTGMAPIYYLYNGLLGSLQLLHIIWTVIITKILYNRLKTGEIKKDERSESEEPVSDTETETAQKSAVNNCT